MREGLGERESGVKEGWMRETRVREGGVKEWVGRGWSERVG